MGKIVISNLDESIERSLRARAGRKGISIEEAAREILTEALRSGPPVQGNLAEAIHRRFAKLGGFDLPKIPREPIRDPETAWNALDEC